MNHKIHLTFFIEGDDLEPDEITSEMGLQPIKKWRKGDILKERKGTKAPARLGNWSIESRIAVDAELDDHLMDVMERIRPRRGLLSNLKDKYRIGLSISLYCYEATGPAVHFKKELLEELGAIGASVDIDLYNLADGSRDNQ